jgi:hypothetical protein
MDTKVLVLPYFIVLRNVSEQLMTIVQIMLPCDFHTIISFHRPVVHGPMGCGQNIFKLVWRCHQLLSWFPGKSHLPRVSHQSRLSANDKGYNEMISEDVHRTPGICLTTEEYLS